MTQPVWMELFFDLEDKRRKGVAPQRVYVTQEQWDELVESWGDGYPSCYPFKPGKGMLNGIPIEVAK